jgi:hypothetical protein
MEFLESTHEDAASALAELVKAEVLAKVTFAMSQKNMSLLVIKAVAEYYSFLWNLRLESNDGKSNKAVEHLVSVVKSATFKALIESKQKDGQVESQEGHLRVRCLSGEDGYHTRRALSCCRLLCAAKDETSVDIMGRMFCCNSLRKSRL